MGGHGEDDAVCIQPFSASLDLKPCSRRRDGDAARPVTNCVCWRRSRTCNKGLHPRPEGDEGRIPAGAPCRLRLEAADHAAVLELERAQVGKRRP